MLKYIETRLSAKKFAKDERGAIKILMAFLLPVLLVGIGSAIDMAELYRARLNFQSAADAATLVAAKTYSKTSDSAAANLAGKALFQENMKNLPRGTGEINFNLANNPDCAEEGIVGTASLDYEVYFGIVRQWFGANPGGNGANNNSQRVSSNTTVKCGNDRLEIALVLDNSGSMGDNGKIGTLKTAAADLVNTLYNTTSGSAKIEPIRFSIVPFAATVNVGANNRNQPWMDKDGISPVHHENLNWELDPNAVKVGNIWRTLAGAALSRFTLYDNLNINWGGCVEARPDPYHTTDAEPNAGTPATMIVPTFAPDTPDNWTNQFDKIPVSAQDHETCNLWQDAGYWWWGWYYERFPRRCRRWTDGRWSSRHPQQWNYRPEYDDRIEYRNGNYIGDNSSSISWQNDRRIQEERYENNYVQDDHNFPSSLGHSHKKEFTGSGEDQYKRQKWTWKYFTDQSGTTPRFTSWSLPSVINAPGGPNYGCSTRPISDLTATKTATINSIENLVPVGATNIQQGLIWGWRTLSPGQPFTNGREVNDLDNKKVIILMSDGNNTYYPLNYFYGNYYSRRNKSYYGAYGHSVNNRIFEGFTEIANPNHNFSTFSRAIDSHLLRTCTNVRQNNITVYTIAFDVPNGSPVRAKLEQCASADSAGNKLYFNADNNAQLLTVFKEITEQLAELTVTE